MARNAHDALEGSLVVDALYLMAETLLQSPTQSLRQSLEGVREAARQEALNSERRLQEALSRAEERFKEALSRAQERFQEALQEGEERAEARNVEQICRAIEEGNSTRRAEIKELKMCMQELEDSVKTALEKVFPRVERLVQQLEEPSPPSPSTSTSSDANSAPPSEAGPSTEPPHSSPSRSCAPANTAPTSSSPSGSEVSQGMALAQAAGRGDFDVVRWHLDLGANVNFSDENGRTPLHAAAKGAHVDVVSLLLERGPDVNAVSRRKCTALHETALKDSTGRCVEALIAAGADVNLESITGCTPLHFAAAGGQERASRALLAAGASKTVRNSQWRMPCGEAVSSSLRGILRP